MKKGIILVCALFSFVALCAFSGPSIDNEKNNNQANIPSYKTNITNSDIASEGSIPGGCYEGTSRTNRGFCRIMISGGTIHVCQRDGTVIARWNIESDKDGVLTLKSEYGVAGSATW